MAKAAIPTFRYLSEDKAEVKKRAETLYHKIEQVIACEVIETLGQVGGGCMPKTKIPSYALVFQEEKLEKFKDFLAESKIPIITMINDDKLILDLKVVAEKDLDYIAKRIVEYSSAVYQPKHSK
jgi:L-seryl-tRNA(Ser) seleniumtransferase